MNDASVVIEVAYAGPDRGLVKALRVARGACVADALRVAGLDADFKDLDLANSAVGIFGKLVRREQVLQDGDRIEIYRPLAQDPKEARRARAGETRKKV